jgi:hypothetical protein
MDDQTEDQQEPTVARRTGAAWEQAKEDVAERNAQARKAGKASREAYERERVESRRAAELRQMTDFLGRDPR